MGSSPYTSARTCLDVEVTACGKQSRFSSDVASRVRMLHPPRTQFLRRCHTGTPRAPSTLCSHHTMRVAAVEGGGGGLSSPGWNTACHTRAKKRNCAEVTTRPPLDFSFATPWGFAMSVSTRWRAFSGPRFFFLFFFPAQSEFRTCFPHTNSFYVLARSTGFWRAARMSNTTTLGHDVASSPQFCWHRAGCCTQCNIMASGHCAYQLYLVGRVRSENRNEQGS